MDVNWDKVEAAEQLIAAAVTLGVTVFDRIRSILIDAGMDDLTIQQLETKWAVLSADVARAAAPTSGGDGGGAMGENMVSAVLDSTVADVKERIAATKTSEELDALETIEMGNPKVSGGRVGVITAIAKRRAELSAE